MANSLSFEVWPTSDLNEVWKIIGADGEQGEEVKITLTPEMQNVELYYEMSQQSTSEGWQFADNGTFFVDAQDNFNYQVNSVVANAGKSMIVSISSLSSGQTIPPDIAADMAANPDKVFVVNLITNNNFEIAYRLIAKNDHLNGNVRYFSQDPRVIIDDPDIP
ncbi:hypothetical protein NI389_11770 [Pseudoalteromonas xiamenensis]|uniref:hypothetical protein n=1 Tax=Pseudoalteromonas xiamenensis TaxID=882626 RepID=UPI0027E40990|nr:hypothetical protein [Pseudoalteromonas xiamenensis]WMN58896.1 hypothetical protein NI389_11770 [Pseudoalteromonas xiamenensis]